QGLAQGAAADSQFCSHFVLPKHLSRAEDAIEDGVPQFFIDDAGKGFGGPDSRNFVCSHNLTNAPVICPCHWAFLNCIKNMVNWSMASHEPGNVLHAQESEDLT